MSPAFRTRKANILYLDAYDSFSNNIIAQVKECLDVGVTQIYIDDPLFKQPADTSDIRSKPLSFREYLRKFDAGIAGPGPGWANQEKDIGLIDEVWKLQDEDLIPVFGVCLGFQSLCHAFGARLTRLTEPRHGLVDEVLHKGRSIFKDVDQLLATQYHSLQVDIGHPIQTKRAVAYPGQLWTPTERCPELEPLAWDFESKFNGAVLMAVRHTKKPFWGVQFHPESICTNSEGNRIIKNWWDEAQAWNRLHNPLAQACPLPKSLTTYPNTNGLKRKTEGDTDIEGFIRVITDTDPCLPPPMVYCKTTGSGQLTVANVCEAFDIPQGEAIVLESGLQANLKPMGVGTGRYSIIGLMIPGETARIHYCTRSEIIELQNGMGNSIWDTTTSDPWKYIKTFMQHAKPTDSLPGKDHQPFWGGLMGYATYEAGLKTIGLEPYQQEKYPDICFVYITRSIVFDHQLKKIYVQSIRSNDCDWVEDARETIERAACVKSETTTPNITPLSKANPFDTDAALMSYLGACKHIVHEEEPYCESVMRCQKLIADGQSYELCLTTQNIVTAPRPEACKTSRTENNEFSFKLYKRLASLNPAPFSAYLRLGKMHVLSSSPERFIHWDRSQIVQCRPIKGTVRKEPGVTFEDANAILSSSKERAENLMIVDLVRHQLHGVYGAGNVIVSQLMQIEEYETLWQLVTVIDAIPPGMPKPHTSGEWEDPVDSVSGKNEEALNERSEGLGFEAFVKSLPPGSMTGAPKKRSCELLGPLENYEDRGLYSGMIGYFDVGGGGDFSVVIRTAVKVDTEEIDPNYRLSKIDHEKDSWLIGAGGAITSQSIPQAEYDEMIGKLSSTAKAFVLQQNGTEAPVDDSMQPFAELVTMFENGGQTGAAEVLRNLQERFVLELGQVPRFTNGFEGL